MNALRIKSPFLLVFLLCTSALFCQDSIPVRKKYFIPGIRYNYGFIIPHAPELEEAAKSYPVGLQADFNWHFNDKKAFSYSNCLPRLGMSVYYWDYRNTSILGQAISVMAFAEPFFNLHHRVNFSVRPGFGLAYMNKPYDSISNPNNLAYSTKIGYSLLLNFTIYFRLTDHWILNTAINYNHISNGGVKHPNKGLNYPTISLGLDYSIRPLFFQKFKPVSEMNTIRKNRLVLAFFIGFKGLLLDDKTYPVYGLYSKYQWQVGKYSLVSGGLEFNIDQTKQKLSEVYQTVDQDAKYILAMTGGYEYILGRFGLSFDLGVYLRNPDQGEDPVFQRYGVKYYFTRSLFAGLNLRAHRHHAEFFDIRLGYTLFSPQQNN